MVFHCIHLRFLAPLHILLALRYSYSSRIELDISSIPQTLVTLSELELETSSIIRENGGYELVWRRLNREEREFYLRKPRPGSQRLRYVGALQNHFVNFIVDQLSRSIPLLAQVIAAKLNMVELL